MDGRAISHNTLEAFRFSAITLHGRGAHADDIAYSSNINPRLYLEYVLNQVHIHKIRRKVIDPITMLPQFIDKNLAQ